MQTLRLKFCHHEADSAATIFLPPAGEAEETADCSGAPLNPRPRGGSWCSRTLVCTEFLCPWVSANGNLPRQQVGGNRSPPSWGLCGPCFQGFHVGALSLLLSYYDLFGTLLKRPFACMQRVGQWERGNYCILGYPPILQHANDLTPYMFVGSVYRTETMRQLLCFH